MQNKDVEKNVPWTTQTQNGCAGVETDVILNDSAKRNAKRKLETATVRSYEGNTV